MGSFQVNSVIYTLALGFMFLFFIFIFLSAVGICKVGFSLFAFLVLSVWLDHEAKVFGQTLILVLL